MRKHSQEFKEKIKLMGRQLNSKITFGETELGNEQLNAVTPVLQSSMLKSVMKELDIDSNVDIPVGTILNYKFGVLIDDENYEYLDFGNYQVYSSEKQEDTNSYNIVAYDKMLNSMVEYTTLKSKTSELQLNRISDSKNLILSSDKEITNDLYQMAEYQLSEPIELNNDYTITIWGNLGEGKESFLIYLDNDYNELGSLIKIDENVYSLSFNKNRWIESHPIDEGKKIIIYAYPRSVKISSTIQKIKLEKGINNSPEWTIAPEDVSTNFPMTIRNYIKCLCKDINLTFANENDEFANYNRILSQDPYENLGYTYRDILDELAQVTASNIVINENDELEIKYITDTNDEIDEEYLKDINVAFGEKYGSINSIVLSRSGGSDNVYLQDEQSVADNGLCELKISDNQIMNGNDRSDYLQDILDKLNGIEFYINDFSSTGVCYYEVADRYSVKIGENTYSCVMFNDEIDITQGLEESIFTDLPEQAETDYTKADKTDRRINQTYLIVDKQNQTITGLVSQVEGQNSKISKVEQTVDGFSQTVQDMQQVIDEGGFVKESEVDSKIEQKAGQIETSVTQKVTSNVEGIVDGKLDNYPTTEQMNSAITQSAGNIQASVSSQIQNVQGDVDDVRGDLNLYIKKDDTGEVVSAFNANFNQVEISSDNFTLNTDGTLVCTGATINNGKLIVTESDFPDLNKPTVMVQSRRDRSPDYSVRIGSTFIQQRLNYSSLFNITQFLGYDEDNGFIGIKSSGRGLGSSSSTTTEIVSGNINAERVTIQGAPTNSNHAVRLQDLDSKTEGTNYYRDVSLSDGQSFNSNQQLYMKIGHLVIINMTFVSSKEYAANQTHYGFCSVPYDLQPSSNVTLLLTSVNNISGMAYISSSGINIHPFNRIVSGNEIAIIGMYYL